MARWNQTETGMKRGPVNPLSASCDVAADAAERVTRRRRLRLMLCKIEGASCLLPLVSDLDSDQLDAMLNLALWYKHSDG